MATLRTVCVTYYFSPDSCASCTTSSLPHGVYTCIYTCIYRYTCTVCVLTMYVHVHVNCFSYSIREIQGSRGLGGAEGMRGGLTPDTSPKEYGIGIFYIHTVHVCTHSHVLSCRLLKYIH